MKFIRLLIVALPLWIGVGALIVTGGFDGLYGQDPFAYYDYAQQLRATLFVGLTPPPFYWPPGYPLLVAAFSNGQRISLLAGGLTAIFTTLWALAITSETTEKQALWPWLAGLLVACTPQLWQSSAVVMADAVGLACATLGAWALTRFGRTGRGAWLWLAALGFAWAMLSRLIYGIVAIPMTAYAIEALWRYRRAPHTWRWACLAALTLGLAVTVATTAVTANLPVRQWHLLNALQYEFNTADGVLRYALPNGLYYALVPAHRYFFTPLCAVGVVVGLWAGWRTQWRGVSLLSVGWVVSVWLYHAGDPYQNFRFTLAYLPPLAVLAAYGWNAVCQRWPRWQWAWRAWLGLGLLAMLMNGYELTQTFIARKNADLQIVQAVTTQLPPQARLLTFGLTATLRHYSDLTVFELYDYPVERLPELLTGDAPLYVLVNPRQIETQWADMPLGAAYRWLAPHLVSLMQIEPYTLYRFYAHPPRFPTKRS